MQPTLGGAFRQFKYSSIKEASLHDFQRQLDLPVLKWKELKHVRWLSYGAAVKASLTSYAAGVIELERQADEEGDVAAFGWLRHIKCYEFVASLHLLADILPVLARLSEKSQLVDLNHGRMQAALETAKTAIKALKDVPGPLFASTAPFIEDLHSDDEATNITITATDARKATFDKNVRLAYLQALLDCLKQHFPACCGCSLHVLFPGFSKHPSRRFCHLWQ